MHLMPGAPIMKSKDLVNWETVNYIFPKLTDSPKYDMKEGTPRWVGMAASFSKKVRFNTFRLEVYPFVSFSKTWSIRFPRL